jgi:uncharacterized coiled-coil protein SlyX
MNKYPFEEHAWNDDLNDTTTWVDGDEAKQAYDAAQSRIQDLEKQIQMKQSDWIEELEKAMTGIADECDRVFKKYNEKFSAVGAHPILGLICDIELRLRAALKGKL